MSTTIVSPPTDEPAAAEPHEPGPQPHEWWPIGVILAAHWVAHQSGPEPDGPSMIEAVNLGLVEFTQPWKVTERGRTALHDHGWL